MKTGFIITGLVLLLIANLLMVYSEDSYSAEGFSNYFLENAGGTSNSYKPIGAFDQIKLPSGDGVPGWRSTSPNEASSGPDFKLGPDQLFMFKNNQVKPECCSASYSSDMGCVCTTPQQRKYINTRGGNRTVEDGI
jgi:hypothetical protein